MNKFFGTLSSFVIVFALGGIIHAQQGPGGPGGPNPAMRAQFEKYRPVFELVSNVRMMSDVDKQKGLAFTKAQAKILLPVLKNLQTRPAITPDDAEKILVNIEDKILTAAQLKWMDAEQLRLQEERRKRAQQQAQNGGGISLPGQGQGGGQNRQGGAGGPDGGMFQAILQGKPFNPFKEGRAQEALVSLIALLEKR
jgi:hypothetical protein